MDLEAVLDELTVDRGHTGVAIEMLNLLSARFYVLVNLSALEADDEVDGVVSDLAADAVAWIEAGSDRSVATGNRAGDVGQKISRRLRVERGLPEDSIAVESVGYRFSVFVVGVGMERVDLGGGGGGQGRERAKVARVFFCDVFGLDGLLLAGDGCEHDDECSPAEWA